MISKSFIYIIIVFHSWSLAALLGTLVGCHGSFYYLVSEFLLVFRIRCLYIDAFSYKICPLCRRVCSPYPWIRYIIMFHLCCIASDTYRNWKQFSCSIDFFLSRMKIQIERVSLINDINCFSTVLIQSFPKVCIKQSSKICLCVWKIWFIWLLRFFKLINFYVCFIKHWLGRCTNFKVHLNFTFFPQVLLLWKDICILQFIFILRLNLRDPIRK